MTESIIKGEVLVPATRFTPKCECPLLPTARACIQNADNVWATIHLVVSCEQCRTPYAIESLDVGIPHGNASS